MARYEHVLWRALPAVLVITLTALMATGCSSAVSIENADVPAWKETTLPTADKIVLEDSGKILNRDALTKDSPNVPQGTYTLTMTCDGGGKAFFSVTQAGTEIADGGAACNGSLERLKVTVPESGAVQISTSSVDAPLLYAYHLAAAS